ncbi:NUDIX hydrolase [Aureivirga sp. CE67]|uniref:NUDIX hydrolase n=1 Tax=Aureivirga sp. CE67 TaxID=1788983 RepID=UPI0018CB2CE5|nr:NUDIX domain-containing protein [Aureivirga sp. CE67]
MYKVFVNDYPIILTDSVKNSENSDMIIMNENNVHEVIQKMFNNEAIEATFYCENLEKDWKLFQSFFKIEKAAGGIVKNEKDEILFIKRFDKWDLPKGKIEKGETQKEAAIREVEEECGIEGLEILNQNKTTYHIFSRKEKLILKISYWFDMKSSYDGKLTPQLEEDITEVIFKNSAQKETALKNTYANIRLLFE